MQTAGSDQHADHQAVNERSNDAGCSGSLQIPVMLRRILEPPTVHTQQEEVPTAYSPGRAARFRAPPAINLSVRTPARNRTRFAVAKAVQERDHEFRMTGIQGASFNMCRKTAWIA